MFDPYTIAIFTDAVTNPRFSIAMGIAVLAGLVRGFTGFGSALIYMPLISAVYGPRLAAPTLLLIDTICSLPFALKAIPDCNWREVRTVMITGAIGVPLGVVALVYVDALALRWFIAVLVLIAVAILASGWRYHGRPTVGASLGVGALAGFGAGAVQIGAPPLLVYWLGGQNSAATVRANIMVYFLMQGVLTFVFYLYGALFTAEALALALLLGLPFGVALALGARWFHGTSDIFYRRLSYIIIAVSGLISLPVFDALR
jgi:uncharacterized membrane protein YfcA